MSRPASPPTPEGAAGAVVRLLRAVAVAANAADVVEDAAPTTLRAVCEFTGWPVGHLYLVDPADHRLRATRWWHVPQAPGMAEFVRSTTAAEFQPEDGLPGEVLRTGGAVWLPDCTAEPGFLRARAATAAGLHAAVAFPLRIRDKVVGVLEFFSDAIADPDAELTAVMTDVGRQLGRVVERSRAAAALRAAQQRLARANEDLQRAALLKDHFLAAVNHELRTPLTTILGFSSTLLERWDRLPEEHRRAFVGNVHDEARRLSALVEDLLTLSSVEAGALDLQPEPVALGPTIAVALEEASMPADSVTVCGAEGLTVHGDRQRVAQILAQCLSNARKYGAPPVVIEARPVDGDIEIVVEDAGPGVPQEFVPSLFERFSQASQGASRTSAGTGLGLAIVRELSSAMGGTVDYQANVPHGSRFVIRLPAG